MCGRFSYTKSASETHERFGVEVSAPLLSLLCVMAVSREGERVSFPDEGVDGGSVSMLTVPFG